ncbi:xanthine dehydrogenase, molybdenum binding subunit apoprotein [Tistlia consotensis]|uniref:CO or xanthine dehydrogenase, Mo-binding subunit n=1 Tax=Tistlia consotensis USBA 355 TaxID=560819 RepID=A0A1Y6CN96_9PROT|nr:xanthine dehydrogenase family protein molybdopterin-binding subunit [Tistlia consotensis]SMF64061.1 CO or xanthine dehydrogenase, Mo-binding subunit [Tistlia consotensis USBA 355]SNR98022.1 xanthine dehydrogenase, molybdenum binding subunit apoprotein [Tistlia consotensis]
MDQSQTTLPRRFKVVGQRKRRPDGIDKVTGRARFGADMTMPGMLWGLVLRSPHAHARIRSIDSSKAEALPGVKAVVTGADFNGERNDVSINCMAGDKALYDGHAVAAVAATSRQAARQALKLIEVDYEVLPHVTDVDAAMKPGAPVIREDLITAGVEPVPTKPSNVAARHEIGKGDVEKGFAEADLIVEQSFRTEATHQGYIEPHACVASVSPDGSAELWVCTQGHFMVRNVCAALLGLDSAQLRVTASEIGGGFGGKTTVFVEPVALALSRKANRPVKIQMTRSEVFRATGPTASSSIDCKIGLTKDGRITAAQAELRYQGGAFKGAGADFGAMAIFTPYDIENVKAVAWDVVTNRPKLAAYRAPGAPMAAFAAESTLDEAARRLGMDPLELRLKNAAREGTKAAYGPTFPRIGLASCLEAIGNSAHYRTPLGPNQGRGLACGFWFNFGGETCTTINVNKDGTVGLSVGTPDIGGSRASMCAMAAEELGIPYEKVRTVIADTASLGYNDVTDGSRVTFSSGLCTIQAARQAIQRLCQRAALMWGIDAEAVVWEDGHAKPAGPNAGKFEPLSLAEIAAASANTGGPIAGHHEVNAEGAGVSFGVHLCDLEVDRETGSVRVVRYTAAQDAGKAVNPDYVEGQMQGGSAQGIGWALNEGYVYGDDGRLQNAGFLDYRIPVASDLPMIDALIVEEPNPGHPYGVRGVGETSIVPPLAAVGNALRDALGVRLTETPMAPPRVLAALAAAAE